MILEKIDTGTEVIQIHKYKLIEEGCDNLTEHCSASNQFLKIQKMSTNVISLSDVSQQMSFMIHILYSEFGELFGSCFGLRITIL